MKTESVYHPCALHPGCHVYWRPDPDRNRLRGRSVHVAAWTLYNGRANNELLVKLPNVQVDPWKFRFSKWK